MKKLSTYRYMCLNVRRSRKPLTHREVRAFLAAADREPQGFDLTCIATLAKELD